MGLIAFGVFQRRVGDRWIDIPSDIDLDERPLNHWLERQEPHRGFPADFEVVEGTCHPIADDDLRPWPDRGRAYPPWHFLHGKILMGDHAHSWLDAPEILRRATEELTRLEAILAEPSDWDRDYETAALRLIRELRDEVERLVTTHGDVRLVFGITY